MELDELKARWIEQDRKLDASLRLNQQLLRESVLTKAGTSLKRLSRGLWFELWMNVAGALLVGSFLGDHFDDPRFCLPAASLQIGIIVLIAAAARQLVAISQIDHGAPIVSIQKRLESLRAERIRTTQWTLILAPLAWTPLFIVAMKGLLNVDVYVAFGIPWVVANVIFGLLVIVAAVWISRAFADRFNRSPAVQRLLRELGGQNLAAAKCFVQSLADFAENSRGER
jgi:hypothetical protein